MHRLSTSVLAAVMSLAACTFVHIEGDHNSVSDTGGHGGGVTVPQGAKTLADKLPQRRNAH